MIPAFSLTDGGHEDSLSLTLCYVAPNGIGGITVLTAVINREEIAF